MSRPGIEEGEASTLEKSNSNSLISCYLEALVYMAASVRVTITDGLIKIGNASSYVG